VRTRYGYGCSGYKAGCRFSVGAYICSRALSLANVKMMLESGQTSKIKGFISKNGKSFDAYLRLSEGKCVFAFDEESENIQTGN
jgi:DNA topoisomerase-3